MTKFTKDYKKDYTKDYKKDYVTIYTDASWCKDHGSWAFWCKSDYGRLTLSGILPTDIEDIFQGEVYAICQGIYKALKNWPNIKGFYINSDNRDAMRFLEDPYREARPSGKLYSPVSLRLKKSFDKMIFENPEDEIMLVKKMDMNFRHVKGHQNSKRGVRYWLNNWCDKEARNVRIQHKNKLREDILS